MKYIKKFNKKPKNIILIIGDGMGFNQIAAAMYANGNYLEMERCKFSGIVKTNSKDNFIADSAATATAISSGEKIKNGQISPNYKQSIIDIAKKNGMGTGIVVTSSLTHATPAGFMAHTTDREDYEKIALDILNSGVDILIGGGKTYFSEREDDRNLIDEFKNKKYDIISDLKGLNSTTSSRILALLYPEHAPKLSEGRGNMLDTSTMRSIDILNNKKNGFVLVVEGSQIDFGGHDNDQDYMTTELIDLDNVIGGVIDFVENNNETLLIVTSDHETGGFSITKEDKDKNKLVGKYSSKEHTGGFVPIFSIGCGSELFTGIMDNTDIFKKIKYLLKK